MEQGAASHRRIGAIMVERGVIDERQLAEALAEQQACGRPLGEICVERFGIDRLHLADALARQWDEIRSFPAPRTEVSTLPPRRITARATAEPELRELLTEAQAARAELETKTEELSLRLAALEALVADVTTALADLRPAPATKTTRKPAARRTRTAV